MSEDAEHDSVEDDLFRMGLLDERDLAIERAAAQGVAAELPELSSAKMDAIVAASLQAAGLEPEVDDAPRSTAKSRRWIAWVGGAGVAAAAVVLLWQAPPDEATSPLPSAQLRLGGTARTLGDTPPVRAYGPGDMFFVELSFDTTTQGPVISELFARDSAGVMLPVEIAQEFRDDAVVFEGEIAKFLPPGVWTLQLRYGRSQACDPSNPDSCEALETRIEVVGP